MPSELIEWHGHNDFYKAVNNSTTAWLYGASGVNCSLFGIGERTGNTPLEAMVFEYAQLRGTLDGMDTTKRFCRTELFRMRSARLSGRSGGHNTFHPVPPLKRRATLSYKHDSPLASSIPQ